jgi:hypothetical protein
LRARRPNNTLTSISAPCWYFFLDPAQLLRQKPPHVSVHTGRSHSLLHCCMHACGDTILCPTGLNHHGERIPADVHPDATVVPSVDTLMVKEHHIGIWIPGGRGRGSSDQSAAEDDSVRVSSRGGGSNIQGDVEGTALEHPGRRAFCVARAPRPKSRTVARDTANRAGHAPGAGGPLLGSPNLLGSPWLRPQAPGGPTQQRGCPGYKPLRNVCMRAHPFLPTTTLLEQTLLV